MNPYQVMGVIACCVSMFAGVVTFLTVQGVPLPLAFLGVYLVALWCMLGMQRRARESYGCSENPQRRRREASIRQPRSIDESRGEPSASTVRDAAVPPEPVPLQETFRA